MKRQVRVRITCDTCDGQGFIVNEGRCRDCDDGWHEVWEDERTTFVESVFLIHPFPKDWDARLNLYKKQHADWPEGPYYFDSVQDVVRYGSLHHFRLVGMMPDNSLPGHYWFVWEK